MCIFHKWLKWRQYEHHYTGYPGILHPLYTKAESYQSVDIRQWRICWKCGTMQDVLVVEDISLYEKGR